ncbi:MAG: DNA-directed RNA polymerase subunit omega [Clostridiales bacterium]|nr:DNA-directed RNA polymerase subunit omega [Clostridiales bacterium]
MIAKPSLEQLMEKADIRFNVVIAVSKRARQVQEGYQTYYEGEEKNPITIATKEIDQGSIVFKTIDEYGEKE